MLQERANNGMFQTVIMIRIMKQKTAGFQVEQRYTAIVQAISMIEKFDIIIHPVIHGGRFDGRMQR
jgi:hypothetical protein